MRLLPPVKVDYVVCSGGVAGVLGFFFGFPLSFTGIGTFFRKFHFFFRLIAFATPVGLQPFPCTL